MKSSAMRIKGVGGLDTASVDQAPGAMALDVPGLELGVDDPGDVSRQYGRVIRHT